MIPIDFRNQTFTEIKDKLTAKREAVWLDWVSYEVRHGQHGATTRQVCQWSGRDILQFRPRCTELFQMGLLKLAEAKPATASSPGGEDTGEGEPRTPSRREGAYVLRSLPEWEAWCAEQRVGAISAQQQLI